MSSSFQKPPQIPLSIRKWEIANFANLTASKYDTEKCIRFRNTELHLWLLPNLSVCEDPNKAHAIVALSLRNLPLDFKNLKMKFPISISYQLSILDTNEVKQNIRGNFSCILYNLSLHLTLLRSKFYLFGF